MQQLPLNIKLDQDISLGSFLAGKNQIVLEYLKLLSSDSNGEFLFLWGTRGCGKSHLLQSLVPWLGSDSVMYLPLSESGLQPEMTQGLEQFRWLLIDDIDHVISDNQWEEALFHLYNRMKDCHFNLIVSSQLPPMDLAVKLRDLQSRLSAMTVFKIYALSDEEKQVLLQQKAAANGLQLSDDVAQFMLTRSSRDLRCLMDSLGKLDKASLIEQRRVTVPFVKQVLKL